MPDATGVSHVPFSLCPDPASTFRNSENLAAAQREVALRKRTDHNWVANGRMAKAEARRAIQVKEAITAVYDRPELFGGL